MRFFFILSFSCLLSAAAQTTRVSTNQLLAEARTAEQSRDLVTAARDFRLVVEMHPKDVEARMGLGNVLTQQAQFGEAIVQLEAALPFANNKRRPSVLTAIGLAHVRERDFAAARAPLQEALTLQTANAEAARLLAEADLALNQAEAALAVLTPRAGAAALDPEFGKVFGMALVRNGKLSDGAQALQHSAEVTGDADTFKLAGVAYLDAGDYDLARRELETARRINGELADIDGLVGIARERCGDLYAAESLFRERLKAQAEDFSANLYLGALLLRRGNTQGATPYLKHALALRPADPLALYEAGMLDSSHRQPESAVAKFIGASKADAAWAEPHLQLATLYSNGHEGGKATLERATAATLTAAQLRAGTIAPHLP